MNLGQYYIGQDFSEIKGEITEFSSDEYKILKRFFKDEKIYKTTELEFCGKKWTPVIGVTQGKIYKISLQTAATEEAFNISEKGIWNVVYNKIIDEEGIFKDQQKDKDTFATTWETKWGNIILTKNYLPNDSLVPKTIDSVIVITVTGNFAFKKVANNQIGFWIVQLVGIILTPFVPDIIAYSIFIVVGVSVGRRADSYMGAHFSNAVLKKGFVYFICILWGIVIAFGIQKVIEFYSHNIILTIISYAAGLYIGQVYYSDKKFNTRAELHYSKNFKTIVNALTILSYIAACVLFYFIFKQEEIS